MNTDHAHHDTARPLPAITRKAETSDLALAARRRRLRRALYDLHLERSAGVEWCRLGEHGLEFADLDDRQIDRLIHDLEDVADRLPARPKPLPGPGQLSFGF